MKLKPLHAILLFCLFISPSQSFAENTYQKDKTIFILHSYSQEYPWTRNEHKGFINYLAEADLDENIHISVEYLDTKRVSFNFEYKEFFYGYLEKKYRNYSPDLIFCTDDNALSFLLLFKNRLFGKTPVIFCGVNDLKVSQKLDREEFTGVIERKEILPNLNLIKEIFRNPGKLMILGDDSSTCKVIVNKIKKDFLDHMPDQGFVFLITENMEIMVEKLKSMEKTTIVLTSIGGLKDKNGTVVPLNTIVRSIVNVEHHAVISMEDEYIQDGVLGGFVTSGISQGREAAKIALKIFMGEKITSIAVSNESPNQYIFNYPEIVRLNISSAQLPEKSIILNRPVSLYEQYKLLIWGIAGAFVLLSIAFISVTFGLINSRRAKKAISDSEKKFRTLFESSMDAIVIIDKNLNFVDCNHSTLRLFGIDSKALFLTMTVVELSAARQPDGELSYKKAKKMVDIALKENQHSFEWKHKTLNGEPFDCDILLSKLKMDGKEMIQVTIRDISEKKRTQELLIQTEKMMSVGGLAAGMAHEINNPLAGVIQNTNVVINRLSSKTIPANQKTAEAFNLSMDAIFHYMQKRDIFKILETVKESGQRIASIVENMLSFSRKSDASFSTHDPAVLIDKTLELAASDYNLKKHYDFKNVTIEKEYAKELPLVQCESSKIQQVIFNIMSNGAHAMYENSNGPAPKFILRLQHEMDSNMLRIEIEDNGPGIDSETCKRIFEPFFTTKPEGEGTGLGLSVSYFIITENHKGTMTVFSEPGEGTKFIIRIPVKRNA